MNGISPPAGSETIAAGFLEAYLAARLGLHVTVEHVTKFARGVSRETWMIAAHDAAGTRHDLILRRDMPSGSICFTSLHFEYDVYARLMGTGLPVAEVLLYEDDPAWLPNGRPFFIRRAIAGSWHIPHFADADPAYDAMRIAVGREHIRVLAALHRLDWREQGFAEIMRVPADAAECADFVIDDVLADIGTAASQPLPLVTEAAEWLRDNKPKTVSRIVLVKGTNGYGEEVFRDGKLVSLSDWELARLGDPALDWAQIQDFVGEIVRDGKVVWGLEPALAYYEELTGLAVDPASVAFYRTLYGLYLMLMSQSAASKLVAGDPFCRLAWVSCEISYRAQRVLGAALGLGAPAPAVRGQLS